MCSHALTYNTEHKNNIIRKYVNIVTWGYVKLLSPQTKSQQTHHYTIRNNKIYKGDKGEYKGDQHNPFHPQIA